MGIEIARSLDALGLRGRLRIYERPAGRRAWTHVGDAENIVVNQWYNDLFLLLTGQGGTPNYAIGAMALGGSQAVPARADVGLGSEWGAAGATVVGKLLSALTGGVPVTSLPLVDPLPVALVSTNALGVGGNAPTVSAAGAAIGATAIPVNSFTPGATVAAGTVITWAAAPFVPQRLSLVLYSTQTADPPLATWSFFLPAAANTAAYQFYEAGMLYNNPSLTAGGAGKFATHLLFSYQKPTNTDSRFDYQLQRIST